MEAEEITYPFRVHNAGHVIGHYATDHHAHQVALAKSMHGGRYTVERWVETFGGYYKAAGFYCDGVWEGNES